ncbi:carbon-nitrogen hydrolase family protein [Stappia sediminis]|uniref:carbon-nitrogen hydrolase family protein n=1 Tax=Stappia sediminis TaxID=2692190 RepID=UPI001925B166|nr:carbon-nitrogen hydrolase family protein [Stappia sediminis]
MKLAACQMPAELKGVEARLAAIADAARQAGSKGTDIAVFPELATTGYGLGDDIRALAEPADGPTIARLKAVSSECGVALVVGLPLIEDGIAYNACAFIAPDGAVSTYSKIQLYGDYEKALFRPGCAMPPIFDYRGMRFGLLICFDVEFPERVRDLALRGAEAILVPTALPRIDGGRFIATSVIPVRAFENQVFVVYANHAGRDARFSYQGLSCIAAPDGSLLAQASEAGAKIIRAELDAGAYKACREQNPYLSELRANPDG